MHNIEVARRTPQHHRDHQLDVRVDGNPSPQVRVRPLRMLVDGDWIYQVDTWDCGWWPLGEVRALTYEQAALAVLRELYENRKAS